MTDIFAIGPKVIRTGSTYFELKFLYHTISLHMNVLESCSVYSNEGPSVWIHMASCLTTSTDHVRLHPLTEFFHCPVLITQFRKVYKALWNTKLHVTLIYTYLHAVA